MLFDNVPEIEFKASIAESGINYQRSTRGSKRGRSRQTSATDAGHAPALHHFPKLGVCESHQRIHFTGAASKILNAERVDRNDSHTELQAPLERHLELVVAAYVPLDRARIAVQPSKAPIAVHDEGDVLGRPALANCGNQERLVPAHSWDAARKQLWQGNYKVACKVVHGTGGGRRAGCRRVHPNHL